MSTVYLSGTDYIHSAWRAVAIKRLKDLSIAVLSPCCGLADRAPSLGDMEGNVRYDEFVFRNAADIKACDAILCNLTDISDQQSISTWWECGLAHAAGKTIVIVCKDEDIKRHPFVRRFCAVCSTLDEALEALELLLDRRHG